MHIWQEGNVRVVNTDEAEPGKDSAQILIKVCVNHKIDRFWNRYSKIPDMIRLVIFGPNEVKVT